MFFQYEIFFWLSPAGNAHFIVSASYNGFRNVPVSHSKMVRSPKANE